MTEMRLVAVNIGTSKIVLSMADHRGVRAAERAIDPYCPQDWIDKLSVLAVEMQLAESNGAQTYVSVCGTSGTFLNVDALLEPVGPVSLYNEVYPDFASELVAQAGDIVDPQLRAHLAPDSSFLKLVRLFRTFDEPQRSRVRTVLPQSVWLLYRLLQHGIISEFSSDAQNCRKLGGNPVTGDWPLEDYTRFGVPRRIFPKIVRAGTALGIANGPLAESLGIQNALLFHGTTDAVAEGLFLTGNVPNAIGVVAGSTTSIKVVTERKFAPSRFGYFAPHPISQSLWSYTAWATGGELVRRICAAQKVSVSSAVKAAWAIDDRGDIAVFPIAQTPIDVASGEDFYRVVRSILESVTYWETRELRYVVQNIGGVGSVLRFMGGTTRSDEWMELRASAIDRSIEVFESVGALGVLLPALSALDWKIADFPHYLGLKGKIIKPNSLNVFQRSRLHEMEKIA